MIDWKEFFQRYRIIDIKGDADLLFQVGATVGGKVISGEQFEAIASSVVRGLRLSGRDTVLDLCCGNGLITFEVAKTAGSVLGIDISKPYITNAIKFKSAPNISYAIADVTDTEKMTEACRGKLFDKAYCYASLSYLLPEALEKVFRLFSSISDADFSFMLGSVLDKDRKWLFFNTLGRKARYFIKHKWLGRDPGLGRWWTKKEIEEIARKYGYACKFLDQDKILHTAHYRFDVIMKKGAVAGTR